MTGKDFILQSDLADDLSDLLIHEFCSDMIEATRSGLKILAELEESSEPKDQKVQSSLKAALDATIKQFVSGQHASLKVWLGISSFCFQELNDLRNLLEPNQALLRTVCDTILTNWKVLMEFYDAEMPLRSAWAH